MAFTDWIFSTRTTGGVPDIQVIGESSFPLSELRSLKIVDQGTSDIATVAFHLDPLLYEVNLDSGRIRTIFQKKSGSGFRDEGIYFLSRGMNPLLEDVEVYAIHITDGGTSLRVCKYTDGLHDFSSSLLLKSYAIPFSGSTESVVMEVEWRGGLLSQELGGVQIQVRFGSNTTNFNNLVELTPVVLDIVSPISPSGGEGIFVRSRSALEPLDVLIDDSSIFRRSFK